MKAGLASALRQLRSRPRQFQCREISSGTLNGIKWFNSLYTNPARPMNLNDLYVVLLGTSSSVPTRFRNVTSTLLRGPAYTYLFDCGENTQAQVKNCWLARSPAIERIFITHLHGDHCYGLPGMLCSILAEREQGIEFNESWRTKSEQAERVTIYGPHGVYEMLSAGFVTLSPNLKRALPIDVVELLPPGMKAPDAVEAAKRGIGTVRYVAPQPDGTYWLFSNHVKGGGADGPVTSDVIANGSPSGHTDHDVRAALLSHTAHCVGYVVSELPRQSLNPEALLAAGFTPGPQFKSVVTQLKAGQPVTTPSGGMLRPSEALRTTTAGRKVVIMGDNCDASRMLPLAQGADVIVHEATLPPGEEAKAAARGHSTSVMAGAFAQAAKAKSLVLTHFGPAFASGRAVSHIDCLGREKVDEVLAAIDKSEAAVSARAAAVRAAAAPRQPHQSSVSSGGGAFTALAPPAASVTVDDETSSRAPSRPPLPPSKSFTGTHRSSSAANSEAFSAADANRVGAAAGGWGGGARSSVTRWHQHRDSFVAQRAEARQAAEEKSASGGYSASGFKRGGASSSDSSSSSGRPRSWRSGGDRELAIDDRRTADRGFDSPYGRSGNRRRSPSADDERFVGADAKKTDGQPLALRRPYPNYRTTGTGSSSGGGGGGGGRRGMSSTVAMDGEVADSSENSSDSRIGSDDGVDDDDEEEAAAYLLPTQGTIEAALNGSRGVSMQQAAALLDMSPGLRANLVNAILETKRLKSDSPLSNHPAKREVVHTTSPRANLQRALRTSAEDARFPDVACYVSTFAYPDVSEHKVMRPVVRAAQAAFGSERVIAARDFMAIPVVAAAPAAIAGATGEAGAPAAGGEARSG